MLRWALVCLIIAILAGVLGFAVLAGTAALLAKIFFFLALVILVISLFTGRGTPPAV